ncbi:MAG: hypothetical protein Q9185_003059 [Variospora sp. 1 TL-2023]
MPMLADTGLALLKIWGMKGWTPHGQGEYAATCIFLVCFAASFRILVAGKHWLEHRWLAQDLKRKYVAVRDTLTAAERINQDPDSKDAILITERGVEENVKVVQRPVRSKRPWRASVDLPRALYATLVAGVGFVL